MHHDQHLDGPLIIKSACAWQSVSLSRTRFRAKVHILLSGVARSFWAKKNQRKIIWLQLRSSKSPTPSASRRAWLPGIMRKNLPVGIAFVQLPASKTAFFGECERLFFAGSAHFTFHHRTLSDRDSLPGNRSLYSCSVANFNLAVCENVTVDGAGDND